ncbi:MAG: valine--tRNA ligase [Bacteroidetes bacterium]|nr:valine--tRNA ligase [Bacteroidota bacterium]
MDIPTKYEPAGAEERWYRYWLENGFFRSVPDGREPYTIVIPPPNVTGVLHMGHMLNNTIQDVLVRRARMQGKNACWVPGTDHASIATEAKVVAKLREEGIDKKELSREQFLEHAWEWTRKHGGIILEQLKRLGASCDWDRTLFTLDKLRYESVIKVFVDLYNKGLIYRGVRMVNWDPQAKTAVSDEEVNFTEENSKLYYVKYRVAGTDEFIAVATTRPETILGDTAVCANPADERYRHMKGRNVIVPMINREVPFIFDDYVEMEFGTGCLKITPAHDINDHEIGLRHNLPSVDVFNDDGTMSEAARLFTGTDRFEARELAFRELERLGAILRVENYRNKIGRSERTNAIIEPRLSVQWFLRMEKLAKPALDAVVSGEVQIHPRKFVNVYRHWMENVRDWCISRQLWWGQRIPAYYYGDGRFVVAAGIDEAVAIARHESGNSSLTANDLKQDEDVLDTWFSSWLWPVTCFNGINDRGNAEMKYYYPSNDLITAPEILFFWVARMIIAGYEFEGRKPFSNVYLHGLVRDKQRRKMSKSLGNSPEPLSLIDTYGADGVRVGMLLCSPAGNDLLYDDSLPEQGRNFSNKIWNAFRLVNGWERDETLDQPKWSAQAVRWMNGVTDAALTDLEHQFVKFRISDALMTCYRLFWDQYSSWFLEIIKPVRGRRIDAATHDAALDLFDRLLRMMHPFMPFITEDIWQLLGERKPGESIMISPMPVPGRTDRKLLADFEMTREIVSAVRTVRKEKKIPNREPIELVVLSEGVDFDKYFPEVISRLCNVGSVNYASSKVAGAAQFMAGTLEFFIPLAGAIDADAEAERLRKEISYYEGFLNSVKMKLSNEGFVARAPEQVILTERKKQSDAEIKLSALREQLQNL